MATTCRSTRFGSFRGTFLVGLIACLMGVSVQRADAVEQQARLRVLIFSGLNNHDWRSTTPVLQEILRGCGRYGRVDVTEAPAEVIAAQLSDYDVIVSNWTPYPDTRRTWRPEVEAAFLEFVSALQQAVSISGNAVVRAQAVKELKDILQPLNLAIGATASSPDGIEPDGASRGDQAAIDGDPNTYWDEVDNADVYRLKVTFREPNEVSSINILWHPYEQHQAKNLDVLCDGAIAAQVRDAPCFEHEMFVAFPAVRCTSLELVIPGGNGLVSPAIHECQIFGNFPPAASGSGAPPATEKGS